MIELICSLTGFVIIMWAIAGIFWFQLFCDDNRTEYYNFWQLFVLYFGGGPIAWFIIFPLKCCEKLIYKLGK